MKKILTTLLPFLITLSQAQKLPTPPKLFTPQPNSWGVEINPIRLLLTNSDYFGFSGTLSHFDNTNGVEIAIPIYYLRDDRRFTNEQNQHYGAVERRLNLDLHYRRYSSFAHGKTESYYVGAFARYTHLDGEANDRAGTVVVDKLGFGGEIGIRVKNIFDTPFYWGASLMIGGYVTGDNNKLSHDMFDAGFDDRQLIVDIELLKIGYEF